MKILISLFLCFQILSCDVYKSKVPITNSESSSINENWVGKWIFLDSDERNRYPIMEINLQAFNDKEYVATVKTYQNKGRRIYSVATYKVHNSNIENSEFLNIKSLESYMDFYILYKIQDDLRDSIVIRYLTDTLEIEFDKSDDLKEYLRTNQSKIENEILSEEITFYKGNSLSWDKINKVNKSKEFEEFYFIGKYDTEQFLKLSHEELEKLISTKDKIKIEKVKEYFQKIHLTEQADTYWKVPIHGVLKMRSGEFLKLKLDKVGFMIKDLTNDIVYLNGNKVKWKF